MNILILSWRGIGHPRAGGAEIVTFEYAKAWVKAGHNVTIFTSFFPGAKNVDEIDGVNFLRSGSEAIGVKWKAFLWYISGAHEKFDLIIDEFHGLPFFTPLYVKSKKLAFIHEVAKEVWKLNPWPKPFNLIPWIFGCIFEPLIFKLFYNNILFMTVSESTKLDLVKWDIPSKKITVINNGVNIIIKSDNYQKEKKKTIIYLGALTKDKGLEDAIKTFSILNQKQNFQFWIVGRGEEQYVKNQKLRIKNSGLNKKIKFWGFVDEQKKFELLSKAHILINPSIREGWGLTVIEAAAMGTPTIGYNVPGLKDSIINYKTGLLVNDRTPNNLAVRITELMNDTKIYKKMCFEAKKWSKNFNWKKSTKRSLGLIMNLKN